MKRGKIIVLLSFIFFVSSLNCGVSAAKKKVNNYIFCMHIVYEIIVDKIDPSLSNMKYQKWIEIYTPELKTIHRNSDIAIPVVLQKVENDDENKKMNFNIVVNNKSMTILRNYGECKEFAAYSATLLKETLDKYKVLPKMHAIFKSDMENHFQPDYNVLLKHIEVLPIVENADTKNVDYYNREFNLGFDYYAVVFKKQVEVFKQEINYYLKNQNKTQEDHILHDENDAIKIKQQQKNDETENIKEQTENITLIKTFQPHQKLWKFANLNLNVHKTKKQNLYKLKLMIDEFENEILVENNGNFYAENNKTENSNLPCINLQNHVKGLEKIIENIEDILRDVFNEHKQDYKNLYFHKMILIKQNFYNYNLSENVLNKNCSSKNILNKIETSQQYKDHIHETKKLFFKSHICIRNEIKIYEEEYKKIIYVLGKLVQRIRTIIQFAIRELHFIETSYQLKKNCHKQEKLITAITAFFRRQFTIYWTCGKLANFIYKIGNEFNNEAKRKYEKLIRKMEIVSSNVAKMSDDKMELLIKSLNISKDCLKVDSNNDESKNAQNVTVVDDQNTIQYNKEKNENKTQIQTQTQNVTDNRNKSQYSCKDKNQEKTQQEQENKEVTQENKNDNLDEIKTENVPQHDKNVSKIDSKQEQNNYQKSHINLSEFESNKNIDENIQNSYIVLNDNENVQEIAKPKTLQQQQQQQLSNYLWQPILYRSDFEKKGVKIGFRREIGETYICRAFVKGDFHFVEFSPFKNYNLFTIEGIPVDKKNVQMLVGKFTWLNYMPGIIYDSKRLVKLNENYEEYICKFDYERDNLKTLGLFDPEGDCCYAEESNREYCLQKFDILYHKINY